MKWSYRALIGRETSISYLAGFPMARCLLAFILVCFVTLLIRIKLYLSIDLYHFPLKNVGDTKF